MVTDDVTAALCELSAGEGDADDIVWSVCLLEPRGDDGKVAVVAMLS